MTIQVAQIGSAFGAVDSDAFADGRPFGAHVLRAMARSTNRLTTKGQHLLTIAWPEENTTGDDGNTHVWGMASTKAYPWWQIYTFPITVPKRPGLNRAGVRIRAKVTDDTNVYFALASLGALDQASATLMPLSHPNVLVATGGGTFSDYSLDDAIISAGDYERLAIWVYGRATLVDNTATYGSPYTATLTYPADGIFADHVVDQSANWNTSLSYPSQLDLANGGNVIQFYGADGNALGGPRQITLVDSPVMLSFSPSLSGQELASANRGASYKILQCARVTLASVSVAAQGRTA